MSNNKHSLLILPGHAIFEKGAWHGGFYGDDSYFETHVRDAVSTWQEEGYAALAFSGGRTRPELGLKSSEGEGMLEFARAEDLLGESDNVLVESFARDSFENVFFSLLVYHKQHGQWPAKLGLVSWPFKVGRFLAIAAALKLGKGLTYYESGELKDAELVARFRKINEDYNARIKQDPLHRGEEFAATRMQRVPVEITENAAYLERVKQAYGNEDLVDGVERLSPGEAPALPWK